MVMPMNAEDALGLADWRRQVFDLYRSVRGSTDPGSAWRSWRNVRDDLFRNHPQSPIPLDERTGFPGVSYFGYDPAYRVTGVVSGLVSKHYEIATSGGETMGFTRFASVTFGLAGDAYALELYWLDGYGGGIFMPFKDATSGQETYGGGRYLLDTIKGADLGANGDRLVLDFNFAYNPSCSYDPRWVCPLSPPQNHLTLRVEAGERTS
jgi:hypothetical protein